LVLKTSFLLGFATPIYLLSDVWVFLLAEIPTGSPATLVPDFGSGLVRHKYKAMKRRKFTVRFSNEEFQALTAFATREHVIHSVAVRWLIEMALANKNPGSKQICPKPHYS
jgi:hypothetical protein